MEWYTLPMAYEKTIWESREGENLDKFSKLQETADSVILINSPDSITSPGTPLSAENMNHMEEGIEAAHTLIAEEAQNRAEADGTVLAEAKTYTDGHNQSETAHSDIREAINLLLPQNLENLPALLASKAPVNNPIFTGQLKAAIAQSTAHSDVLVADAAGAVFKRPASGLTVAHAATAGAATNKTYASSQVISPNAASALALVTQADLVRTIAYMIRNPPPAPTGIIISPPPATVYGGGYHGQIPNLIYVSGEIVEFTATVTPADALGNVVDWAVTGSFADANTFNEGLPSAGVQVEAGRYVTNSPANWYKVTATIRGTNISSSVTVNFIRRPGAKP